MRYFVSTNFIERYKKPLFGKKYKVFDLISVGIVCEDGREFYAVSNEFKIKHIEWRDKESVLNGIFWKISERLVPSDPNKFYALLDNSTFNVERYIKKVLPVFGKPLNVIQSDVMDFILCRGFGESVMIGYGIKTHEFYGYDCCYDWVVFCSLFGTVDNLPKGFPASCIDLMHVEQEFKKSDKWEKRSYKTKGQNQYPSSVDLARGFKEKYDSINVKKVNL